MLKALLDCDGDGDGGGGGDGGGDGWPSLDWMPIEQVCVHP